MELGATGNVNFDLGRHGIGFTASPRHADGVVVSGPVTRNMAEALEILLRRRRRTEGARRLRHGGLLGRAVRREPRHRPLVLRPSPGRSLAARRTDSPDGLHRRHLHAAGQKKTGISHGADHSFRTLPRLFQDRTVHLRGAATLWFRSSRPRSSNGAAGCRRGIPGPADAGAILARAHRRQYVGLHRLQGPRTAGAVAASLGAVLPSFLIILIVAIFFAGIRHNPVVDAAFKGCARPSWR